MIIIPARSNSRRLPGKLLLKIGEKTLLQHVYDSVKDVSWADVYISAADDKIEQAAREFTNSVIRVENTLNGTHSCYYANLELDYDVVINLQSDNFGVKSSTIKSLYNYFKESYLDGIVTGCYPLSKDEAQNPNRVKLVKNYNGKVFYFSRLPIPYGSEQYVGHFGCYLFNKEDLYDIGEHSFQYDCSMKSENLEQLYFLEDGYHIHAEWVEPSISIDTIEDYELIKDDKLKLD